MFAIAAVVSGAGAASATTGRTSVLSADVALGEGSFGPGCTSGGTLPSFCDSRSLSFRLFAVSGPRSGRGTGWFERTNVATGAVFAGPVMCLNVQGNMASIGGVFTQTPSSTGQGVGDAYLVYVVDGGSSSLDGISPLEALGPGDPGLASLPPGFPRVCPAPGAPLGYFSLTSGGITVLDG